MLLELVADVQGVHELDERHHALLDAVERAVPADWVSLNDVGPGPNDVVAVVRPEMAPEEITAFAVDAHENPLLQRWLRTRDGRAYRFSDVATRPELDRLALFREFYYPLGVRHQIAFVLPGEPDRTLAVALSRGRAQLHRPRAHGAEAPRARVRQARRGLARAAAERAWALAPDDVG